MRKDTWCTQVLYDLDSTQPRKSQSRAKLWLQMAGSNPQLKAIRDPRLSVAGKVLQQTAGTTLTLP
jgi:hypothetical protein